MPKKKDNRLSDQINDMEGIIIPVHWDEEGNPVAIALATSQEEEFLINIKNKKGKKLLEFVRKKVRIQGAITLLGDNQKMITIRKCLPIAYDEFAFHGSNKKMHV